MISKPSNHLLISFLFILIVMIPFTSFCQKTNSAGKSYKYRVPFTGILYFTSSYCGGARPTQEILKKYSTVKILPLTTLHLREISDTSTVYYGLTTDKDGKFTTCIPPGTYNVYMTDKYDTKSLPDYDPECKQWLEHSLTQIEIKDDIPTNTDINLRLFFHCNPCMIPRS